MTESLLTPIMYDFWILGMKSLIKLFAIVAVLIVLTQIVWLLYRYVTDASVLEKEKFRNRGRGRCDRERLVFCGDVSEHIPEPWPGSETRSDDVAQFLGALFLYFLMGIVAAVLWPLLLLYIVTHGSLFLARAVIRFKRKVNKALEAKANKDHDHDGRYVKK